MDKAEPISLHLRLGITKRMNLGGILFISMSIIQKYCLMKEDEIYIYTRYMSMVVCISTLLLLATTFVFC